MLISSLILNTPKILDRFGVFSLVPPEYDIYVIKVRRLLKFFYPTNVYSIKGCETFNCHVTNSTSKYFQNNFWKNDYKICLMVNFLKAFINFMSEQFSDWKKTEAVYKLFISSKLLLNLLYFQILHQHL